MIVKLNNGAVREIKKAEPMVEKRFEFNGNSYRMIAKANSNKEDITGVMFKFNNDRDDNMSVFAVNEENVFVGNTFYIKIISFYKIQMYFLYIHISKFAKILFAQST
jgi:hypothetical protein